MNIQEQVFISFSAMLDKIAFLVTVIVIGYTAAQSSPAPAPTSTSAPAPAPATATTTTAMAPASTAAATTTTTTQNVATSSASTGAGTAASTAANTATNTQGAATTATTTAPGVAPTTTLATSATSAPSPAGSTSASSAQVTTQTSAPAGTASNAPAASSTAPSSGSSASSAPSGSSSAPGASSSASSSGSSTPSAPSGSSSAPSASSTAPSSGSSAPASGSSNAPTSTAAGGGGGGAGGSQTSSASASTAAPGSNPSSAAAGGGASSSETMASSANSATASTQTVTSTTYDSRCSASTTKFVMYSNTTTGVRPCNASVTNACGSSSEYCMPMSTYNSVMDKTSTCKLGLCMPVISTTSSVPTSTTTSAFSTASTALSTVAVAAYPRRYGQSCTSDSDCYTGYCSTAANSTCTCSSCSVFVVQWGIDASSSSSTTLTYSEMCIPKTSPIVSTGQTCGSFKTDPPTSACDTLSICSKCPEYWNNTYVEPTCIAVKFPSVTSTSSCSCGNLATCQVVNGISACTCPSGFELHSNLKDCYGWKSTAVGSCNVTCGYGYQSVTQVCDAPSELNSPCLTSSKKSFQQCYAGRCSFDGDAQKYAVDVCFTSYVITVDLFNSIVAPLMKESIAKSINSLCINDSSTFTSCCPNKVWSASLTGNYIDSSGVLLLNPDTNGATFCVGLMITANASNALCQSANASTTTGRKKRLSDAYIAIDQNVLASIAQSVSVLSGINGAIQTVDSTATVSSSSVGLATTTTTTTTKPAGSNSSSGVDTSASASGDSRDPLAWVLIGGKWIQTWIIAVAVVAPVLLFVLCVVFYGLYLRKNQNPTKVDHEPIPRPALENNPLSAMQVSSSQLSADNRQFSSANGVYTTQFAGSEIHQAPVSVRQPQPPSASGVTTYDQSLLQRQQTANNNGLPTQLDFSNMSPEEQASYATFFSYLHHPSIDSTMAGVNDANLYLQTPISVNRNNAATPLLGMSTGEVCANAKANSTKI